MAKIVLAAFCQSAVIDRATNNLSILNQFDQLHPSPPPKTQGKRGIAVAGLQCMLACVWERERPELSETVPMRIRLIGPTKKSLPIAEAYVDLRKTRRFRMLTNLPGLPVMGEGTYTFVYEVRFGSRWKRAIGVSFVVTYNKATRAEKRHTPLDH